MLTLETAINRALDVSPEVGQVAAQRDFAAARYRFARANRFLTKFEATSAHAVAPGIDNPKGTADNRLYLDPDVRNDWNDLRPFNAVEVEATQPLWTWGELSGSIRAARHGVELEAAAMAVKADEVAVRTGELYYGLLLTDALFRLTDEAGGIVEQAKREINRLMEEGDEGVDDADLFEVRITEQEFNRRVVEVREKQATARTALVRQLFLPPGTTVAAQARLEPLAFPIEPLETYFALAFANRPELDQARAGLAAREALVTVARSDYYPKLALGISANYAYAAGRERQRNPYVGDPFLRRSVRAGIGLQQKLNFFQTKAKVEQAEAERNEVRFQQQAAEQLILFQVEEAYRNLIIAKASLDAQREALTISGEWLRTEQINFDLELGDTENLVRAVRANLELQAASFEAIYDFNVAVLRLMNATGTLTAQAQSGTLVD